MSNVGSAMPSSNSSQSSRSQHTERLVSSSPIPTKNKSPNPIQPQPQRQQQQHQHQQQHHHQQRPNQQPNAQTSSNSSRPIPSTTASNNTSSASGGFIAKFVPAVVGARPATPNDGSRMYPSPLPPSVNAVVVAAATQSSSATAAGSAIAPHAQQPPQQQQKSNAAVVESVAATATTTTTSSASVKKRLKLGDSEPTAAQNPLASADSNSLQSLRKRILDHKFSRLKHVKDKHSENVHELFYLQGGGNMMDYPVWKKKSKTPQFLDFLKACQLDPPKVSVTAASTTSISTASSTAQPQSLAAAGVSGGQQQHRVLPGGGRMAGVSGQRSGSSAATASSASSKPSASAGLPHGAEIKIPGVGATPVAVSTTLPAAVVQLSQQGGTPLLVEAHRDAAGANSSTTNNSNSLSINLPNHTTPSLLGQHALTGGTSASLSTTPGSASTNAAADHFSVKMRQEVYVMQRISELQREGMWTDRRLPKCQEPQRPKAHWDYLLEEMVWLASDFAQERKWKKAAAKKCSRMVLKYFADKALVAQRLEKAQELQLRRIAAAQSKEIKLFWSNVEKLVEYKQHTHITEKRKQAMDQHLSFIVDQTERFSKQLAVGMNKGAAGMTATPADSMSNNSSRVPSLVAGVSDDEFSPGNASSDDDEETIAQAERDIVAHDVNDEIAALQKESEMDLDQFLDELPANYLKDREGLILGESKQASLDGSDDDEEEEEDEEEKENESESSALDQGSASTDKAAVNETANDRESNQRRTERSSRTRNRGSTVLTDTSKSSVVEDDDDGEYSAKEQSEDDEDTIREQEASEQVDHQKEVDELNADNDMTIEELMAKYKAAEPKSRAKSPVGEKISASDTDEDSENEADVDDDASSVSSDNVDDAEDFGLNSLLEPTDGQSGGAASTTTQDEKSQIINDAAAIAESIQPKGNTLSSTDVVTPVPFLLKHTLREYQHIGLDWLVTMHDRKLNGILADEMGLGKTIQTISLLAHLACVKENWGPHLIVVPSSVMLNWEMEFKKWCPGFKILTYYGTQKERKQKRVGWTKINAFHICITSYKLVIQDHQSFRRKKWQYLILDEAQNIKNFKSQRWQLLLNFATEQRLLLTGTPLQNNLMELWSLMHFLMPHVFQSHREFKEWFSNPMTGMIEGNSEYNESIIKRLHKVLRPFLLRRLKSEVEKQMPKKYEHVVMCRLSNRQRYLYDDFMSRAKTRETLASGNLLSVINVLMQLRKVCNHPNMFEVRPTISPFRMDGLQLRTTTLVYDMLNYDPFNHIDLNSLNLVLVQLELCITAYVAHRAGRLQTPRRLIEELPINYAPPPRCPNGRLRMYVRFRDAQVQQQISRGLGAAGVVKVGTSPAIKIEDLPALHGGTQQRKSTVATSKALVKSTASINTTTSTVVGLTRAASLTVNLRKRPEPGARVPAAALTSPHTVNKTLPSKRNGLPTTASAPTTPTSTTIASSPVSAASSASQSSTAAQTSISTAASAPKIAEALAIQLKNHSYAAASVSGTAATTTNTVDAALSAFTLEHIDRMRRDRRAHRLQFLGRINKRRCAATPIYGGDLRDTIVRMCTSCSKPDNDVVAAHCPHDVAARLAQHFAGAIKSMEQRTAELEPVFGNFVIYVPAVSAPLPALHVSHANPSRRAAEEQSVIRMEREMSARMRLLHPIVSAMNTQFPDPRLIQYDCGKLQTLNRLLRQLKADSHRVLIFTQMTRMLDILEAFLNYHGHIYLRLDGSTRIEQRQVLMDRFNNDRRIFVFILSTRSGGVGVNLTGADTVIFYDSDWNPTMDAQAQDRCHRIGQTRDVHIYRLVSEKTIEENILKKANQKRLLGSLAIEGGNFTTDYFKSSTIQDLFVLDSAADGTARAAVKVADEKMDTDAEQTTAAVAPSDETTSAETAKSTASTSTIVGQSMAPGELESALAAAEDEQDVQAAKVASAEAVAELDEFDETIPIEDATATEKNAAAAATGEMSKAEQEVENLVQQLNPIERYAMRFVEETGGLWIAEQLRIAEAEIEQQKRNWEADRLAALQKEQEEEQQRDEEELLTYSRSDAKNQVNNRSKYVNRRLKRGQPPQTQAPSRGGPKRDGKLSSSKSASPAPRAKTNNTSSLGSAASFRRRQQPPHPRTPTPPQPRRIVPKRSSTAQVATTSDKRAKIMPNPLANTKKRAKSVTTSGAKTPTRAMRQKNLSNSRRTRARDDDDDDDDDGTEESSSSESGSEPSAENGSDGINHDEDDDSECSLDAMYDSIDDDQSDDNQRSSISESEAEEEDEDDDDDDDDDEIAEDDGHREDDNNEVNADSDEESVMATKRYKTKRHLVPPTIELNGTTSPMTLSTGARQRSNHVDINSPRTRSRGTVQLDLWTLDDSPICPDIKTSKRRSLKAATSFGASSSATIHVLDSDESDAAAAAAKTASTFVEPADRECKRNGSGSVRNVTLDKWISKSPRTMRSLSPMVILCKDDVSRMMHARSASRVDGGGGNGVGGDGGEAIGRRTRGSSVAKTSGGTPENGMS